MVRNILLQGLFKKLLRVYFIMFLFSILFICLFVFSFEKSVETRNKPKQLNIIKNKYILYFRSVCN